MNSKPLILLALVTPCLWADEPRPASNPSDGPCPPPPDRLVAALDIDHDHVISAKEIADAPNALLTLDLDGGGSLTPDEIAPPPPGDLGKETIAGLGGKASGKRPGPPPSPLLVALDLDRNGTLSADEIAAAPDSLATIDRDDDGKLDPREFCPPPPKDGDDFGHPSGAPAP